MSWVRRCRPWRSCSADLAKDHAHEPELAQDIATLRDQVHACKQIITRIVAAAGQARAEGGCAQPVDHFVRETLEGWRLTRPSVLLTERLSGEHPAPNIVTEQTLRQAIINLLNNAADVSPQNVELECRWDREHLQLEIHDRGPGLTNQAREQVGTKLFHHQAGRRRQWRRSAADARHRRTLRWTSRAGIARGGRRQHAGGAAAPSFGAAARGAIHGSRVQL